MTQPQTAQFNYAGLEPKADFLPCLKLEDGKQALVAFLKDIPGMQSPPFVYAKVHWNQEMGDNGRLFQCFGGACCQQVTWQKGWGGEPGKFDVNKARTRFYIPVVHYAPSETNPAVSEATIKYIDMTYTAYDALIKAIANTTEGLSFYDRDIAIEPQKVNGATIYLFHKRETQAQWKTNAVFTEQVNAQLPTVAQRLFNAMPKTMTEAEFMAMKPTLDAKVQAKMQSHDAQMPQQAQAAQSAYNAFPTAQQMPTMPQVQPAQFTQPTTNIPIAQPAPQGTAIGDATFAPPVTSQVPQVEVPQAQVPQTETIVTTAAQQTEVPTVTLDFDPSKLMK